MRSKINVNACERRSEMPVAISDSTDRHEAVRPCTWINRVWRFSADLSACLSLSRPWNASG